ncbi:MAG: DUF4491 family protein [Tannerellaceae bacterium]|nr:DUF4491 family protein [Tannerellaceae bacterium]
MTEGMSYEGLLTGVATFVIIGLFHPLVIKAEYYVGVGCWWVFLVGGVSGLAGSVYAGGGFVSSALGVFGFSSFWAIRELFEQERRVSKGWFPSNPKRRGKKRVSSK